MTSYVLASIARSLAGFALCAACSSSTRPATDPPPSPSPPLAARIDLLDSATQITFSVGDLDGDGLSEVVLTASGMPDRAAALATSASPSALDVVLTHASGQALVAATDNAPFDFSRARVLGTALVAPVAESHRTFIAALRAASLSGAACSVFAAALEFLNARVKATATLASLALVEVEAYLGWTDPLDELAFELCLTSPQTVVGCALIQIGEIIDVGDHCYEVPGGGPGRTSCLAPPAPELCADPGGSHSILCLKSEDPSGCCNLDFIFDNLFVSDLNNTVPLAVAPSSGPIPDADTTVLLSGPSVTQLPFKVAQALPAAAACFADALGASLNPITLSLHREQHYALNTTQPYHVLQGTVCQGLSDDPSAVYSLIIGQGNQRRWAELNQEAGPTILSGPRDHLRDLVGSTLFAMQQHGLSCQGSQVIGPDGVPLPPGTTGVSLGDPHLLTFGSLRYDMQAVGEFTFEQDSTDPTEIQVRTAPWGASTTVAINVAVAARVGDDVVAFYSGGTVRINHVVTDVASGRTPLRGGVLFRQGSAYVVVWPDNTQLRLDLGQPYIAIRLYPADARRGRLTGLLGRFDASPASGLVTRAGATLPSPVSFDALYGDYAEGWRIAQADSLFDYSDGTSTETFTDRSFPHQLATSRGLSDAQRAAATAACQAAGVPADWFNACLLDVGLTGEPRFAQGFAGAPSAAMSVAVVPPRVAIPGLFPTGVDDAGAGLASAASDPHYQIVSPAGPAIVINPGAGAWIPNAATYRWVWQTAQGQPVNVTRTFRLTFSLDGLEPGTASITGQWATDNLGVDIALNSHGLGIATTAQFQRFTPFTIAAGNPFFVAGVNTLDFTVSDQGGIAGLLVGAIAGTAQQVAGTP